MLLFEKIAVASTSFTKAKWVTLFTRRRALDRTVAHQQADPAIKSALNPLVSREDYLPRRSARLYTSLPDAWRRARRGLAHREVRSAEFADVSIPIVGRSSARLCLVCSSIRSCRRGAIVSWVRAASRIGLQLTQRPICSRALASDRPSVGLLCGKSRAQRIVRRQIAGRPAGFVSQLDIGATRDQQIDR